MPQTRARNTFDNIAFHSALQPGKVYQKDAPDDLKVVSWPSGQGIEGIADLDYNTYDRNGGQHSVV